MRKSTVILTGYYGKQNFGDDVFSQVATWGVNRYWEKQGRFFVHETPVFPEDFDYHKPSNFKIKAQSICYQYLESIFSKLIVYGGGSIFHTAPSRFHNINYLHYFLSYVGKQLGAIGISVGPFKTNKDYIWIQKFLSRFSYISVRDGFSFKLLNQMSIPNKVIQGFDLAVLYPKIFNIPQNSRTSNKPKIIGISLCHYERYVGKNIEIEKQREEAILIALKTILEKRDDVNLHFYILNSNLAVGDQEITKFFISHLQKYRHRIEYTSYQYNPKLIVDDMSHCDFILGIRLHSAIMAYTIGMPFLLVEYHPKCRHFLDDINYPKKFRFGNDQLSSTNLIDCIEYFLGQQKSFLHEELLPLQIAQEMAKNNFIEAPWVSGKV